MSLQDSTEPKKTFEFTTEDRIHIILSKYEKTQQMGVHYDTMNMQFSGIITAGVFVLWGLVFQVRIDQTSILKIPSLIVLIELFAFSILYIWLRYITIHRRIIVRKFNRIQEIEDMLEMEQHRMFRYRASSVEPRPGGHTTEIILFFVLTLFGFAIAAYSQLQSADPSNWQKTMFQNWGWKEWARFAISFSPCLLMIRHGIRCKMDVVRYIPNYIPVWYWALGFRFERWQEKTWNSLVNFLQQTLRRLSKSVSSQSAQN